LKVIFIVVMVFILTLSRENIYQISIIIMTHILHNDVGIHFRLFIYVNDNNCKYVDII